MSFRAPRSRGLPDLQVGWLFDTLESIVEDHPEIIATHDVSRRELPVRANTNRDRIGDRHARPRSRPQKPVALLLDPGVSAVLRRDLPGTEARHADVQAAVGRAQHS